MEKHIEEVTLDKARKFYQLYTGIKSKHLNVSVSKRGLFSNLFCSTFKVWVPLNQLYNLFTRNINYKSKSKQSAVSSLFNNNLEYTSKSRRPVNLNFNRQLLKFSVDILLIA